MKDLLEMKNVGKDYTRKLRDIDYQLTLVISFYHTLVEDKCKYNKKVARNKGGDAPLLSVSWDSACAS